MIRLFIICLALTLTACNKDGLKTALALPPGGEIGSDGAIVRARAIIDVDHTNGITTTMKVKRFLEDLLIPKAVAYLGSPPAATITVSYTNAEAVSFTLNTSSFGTSPSMSGSTLTLGSLSVSGLSDNKLRVCTSPTKCQKAVVRVYTTGSMQGFINSTDGDHAVPVYFSGLNPSTAVGLTSANAVETTSYNIPGNKNVLSATDLGSPSYTVTSDMSNAGAGSYSMTLVVEYALKN
jgi:hypothetical protein